MNATETRILPLPRLSGDYALVSLPRTAWYWLDDLVSKNYSAGGYKALMRDFTKADEDAQALSRSLGAKAQELCESQMGSLYNLANDNRPQAGYRARRTNPGHPATPNLTARMPTCYRLFHFMPHATYLTTIWERRNYHLRNFPA